MTTRKWFALACVVALLVGSALGPRLVWGTGSLSIPNVIANQAAGNVQASLLDTNWNTTRDYINNREVAIGTLGARPAAGTAGRWYLASDTNGGTLYADSGSGWTQAGAGVTQSAGSYALRGLVAGTASLTVVNASASLVNLRNPSDGSITVQTATATRSNDILTAGPAANGRDRAAQFSDNTWVHVYYIWNGTTLSTLSSACAPSDVNGACSSSFGPVLPSAYTHWAYIGAYRNTTANTLLTTHQRGSWLYYPASQNAWLNLSNAASETRINVATLSASNALSYRIHFSASTIAAAEPLTLRLIPGTVWWQHAANTNTAVPQFSLDIPELGVQQFYFNLTTTARTVRADVAGYRVPNGSE